MIAVSARLVALAALAPLLLLGACNGDDAPAGTDTDSDDAGIVTAPTDAGATTGDTTQGGDGVADESTDEGFSCGESEFMLEALPTKVMLVLDKSASMVTFTWDHDDDPDTAEVTRWFSLHQTVSSLTTTFDASIEFGAVLYPSVDATSAYTEEACLVSAEPEVAVAPNNAQAVIDAIPNADAIDEIQGGTPSRAAVETALAHLDAFETGQPRAILFITDGEANCQAEFDEITELFEVYDGALHTVVADAFDSQATPTYVVGIAIRDEVLPTGIDGTPDGINPSDELDDLAELGGRPNAAGATKYYATTNQLELEAALAEIVGEEFNCRVPLTPTPDNPEFVEIEIGGEPVARVSDCATEHGWVYVNPDGPYDTIELCGDACTLLAQQGSLQANYGCPPAD